MNIKEFIEKSGLIEDYVLGKLSPKDAQGVECLSKTYPEIALEIADLQKGLNAYASTFEKKAPAFLKDQIFAQMTFADEQEQSPAEQNLSSQGTASLEQICGSCKYHIYYWHRMALFSKPRFK
jgi:anti-sigma-K factor RskA